MKNHCKVRGATLECELLDRQRFTNPAEARRAVFEFIEGWYNRAADRPQRRHSTLDYLSPIDFGREVSSNPGQRPGGCMSAQVVNRPPKRGNSSAR